MRRSQEGKEWAVFELHHANTCDVAWWLPDHWEKTYCTVRLYCPTALLYTDSLTRKVFLTLAVHFGTNSCGWAKGRSDLTSNPPDLSHGGKYVMFSSPGGLGLSKVSTSSSLLSRSCSLVSMFPTVLSLKQLDTFTSHSAIMDYTTPWLMGNVIFNGPTHTFCAGNIVRTSWRTENMRENKTENSCWEEYKQAAR